VVVERVGARADGTYWHDARQVTCDCSDRAGGA
jgi:hypothetical protein